MRRVTITGCGGGLGGAIMNNALKKGHKVFPHYRRNVEVPPKILLGDISDYGFADKFENHLQVNNIEVFVNNAPMYIGGPIEKMSDLEIERAIDINVTSQILLMKKSLSQIQEDEEGLIININSLAYQQPSTQ